MGRIKGELTTLESFMIAKGEIGDHFYSDKKDNHLTSIATHHNRKILTERLLTVTTRKEEPIAKYITKVTLLEHINQ